MVAAHRPVLVDFLEDHIRAFRRFFDPKNREESLPILGDVTQLPKEKLAFAFAHDDFHHSPNAHPDVVSVQMEVDASAETGVVPKRMEIPPAHLDLSLIEEAKRRIDGE